MINSILLLSQLVIPQIPSNITQDNFIQETLKTFDCVGAVENDEMVTALSMTSTEDTSKAILIVAVKDAKKTAACAKEISTAIDHLNIEGVLPNLGLFIVSYDNTAPTCFITHSCLK